MADGEVFRHGDVKLSGIAALKGKYAGQTAVLCCSGTTLNRYNDDLPPRHWPRFAINEAVKKLGPAANFWVLADDPIVHEYAKHCFPSTTVLCMHQATRIIRELCKSRTIHTVESMPKPGRYDNGFQFYSRGTVMIGAVEMARYMGFTRFFVFGLDCFREKNLYYYDGRTPLSNAENDFREEQRITSGVTPGSRIYVTPRLKNMIERLDIVRDSGLWAGVEIWCVDSPDSQQRGIPKMSIGDFAKIATEEPTPSPATIPPEPARICTVPPTTTTCPSVSVISTTPPRGRGRPRKYPPPAEPAEKRIPFGDGFYGTVPTPPPEDPPVQDVP